MPETDIRTLVSIETENKGVESAKRALKEVVKAQADLISEFKNGDKAASQFNSEMDDLVKQEKALEKAIDNATGEISAQRKEMAKAAEEAAHLAREQAELSTAQGRFDKTSQNVALAGDAESSLRTLSGGLGFVGGDVGAQIEQQINVLAEGFAALEAAPKLKESLAGIPGVVNNAAQALGTSGAGLIGSIGAVGIAVAALSVAFKLFADEQAKQAEATKSRIQAISEVNQELSGGITTDEIKAKIEELNAANEGYTTTLDRLQTTYDDNITKAGAFGNVLQVVSGAEEELANGINNTKTAIDGNNQAIRDYERALESGTAAANDAAEAERQLAQERTASVLASGQEAASLEQARQQTEGASQEQLESLIQAEQNRIDILQAELDALIASGDTSEQVTSRIKQLQQQLGTASKRLDEFKGAVGRAPEAAKGLASALSQQAKATDQAANAARKAAGDFASSASSIASSANRARRTARSEGRKLTGDQSGETLGLNDSYTFSTGLSSRRKRSTPSRSSSPSPSSGTSLRSSANDLLNAQVDLNNALSKARQNTVDKLDDLRISLRDGLDDAFEEGNFLGIADITEDAKRQERDLLRDEEDRFRDINTDYQQRLFSSIQSTNQQRLQIEAQGQQAMLNQQRTFWQKMTSIARGGQQGGLFKVAQRTL